MNVDSTKRRILYVEGEPRWEYKFIRRAEEDDRIVSIASMLRTTENKIYRQGIDDPKELADGFPSTAEDLFNYQGLIIGSVEANYFTPAQQELIQQFVDRRGGGLLLLGGRVVARRMAAGARRAWRTCCRWCFRTRRTHFIAIRRRFADAGGRGQHHYAAGRRPGANVERWKKLPYLMDYQDPGTPKPGAAVLAEMTAGGQEDAAADHGKLRPRAHRRAGHGRHLALADEPAAGGSDARGFLAAIAALAGDGYAGARGGLGAEPDAV